MSVKSDEVFVKPAEGLRIVNPNAQQRLVSEKGELLKRTTGVRRLIKAKDLIECAAPKKARQPKPPETTEDQS